MLTLIWCAIWLAFVQKFNHFDSQLLETLELKLFLKISVHLQASMQPFIWARVASPTSYLSKNFELLKCWKSEVQHPSCSVPNFPTIQTVDINIFLLVLERTCPPYLLNLFFDIFKSFPLFIMIEFWVLASMLTLSI